MDIKTIVILLILIAGGALFAVLETQHLHHDHDHSASKQEAHDHDHDESQHQHDDHTDEDHSEHDHGHHGHGHDHHGHGDHHAEEPKGEHGGKLLTQDKFTLELTIFEQGIPPEMRLYAFFEEQPISPENIQVEVRLQRLGGEQDVIKFSPEADYLVGNQIIREPHSYHVSIEASYQGQSYQWQYESYEGRSHISDRLIEESGLKTEIAGSQTIHSAIELYGIIDTPQDKVTKVFAPYPSQIEKIYVRIGDQVRKGQRIARLKNIKTLQSYDIKSPAQGQVSQRWTNPGEIVQQNALVEITDLSSVWVELSAFPNDLKKLQVGLPLTVYSLHGEKQAQGQLDYISPTMTEGHIARARAVIPNPQGFWRPGMHIKAQVEIAQKQVPLAVQKSALQSFRGMPVVFAKFGNDFEVRMIEMGIEDDHYIEVLGGLKPGTEYVVTNSFLLKADVMKDGASHDH